MKFWISKNKYQGYSLWGYIIDGELELSVSSKVRLMKENNGRLAGNG
jgi:hypothetical protein